MNNLLDLVSEWANKLTYRVLKMSGASETALNNYISGVKSNNQDIISADSELAAKLPRAKLISFILLILGGLFLLKIVWEKLK